MTSYNEYRRVKAILDQAQSVREEEEALSENVAQMEAWLKAKGIDWDHEYRLSIEARSRLGVYSDRKQRLAAIRAELVLLLLPVYPAVTMLCGVILRLPDGGRPEHENVYRQVYRWVGELTEVLLRCLPPERRGEIPVISDDGDFEAFFGATRLPDDEPGVERASLFGAEEVPVARSSAAVQTYGIGGRR